MIELDYNMIELTSGMFILGMMRLPLFTHNMSYILYRFILDIVSATGRHLFTTKGEALVKCLELRATLTEKNPPWP